jgi:hypothetical protein
MQSETNKYFCLQEVQVIASDPHGLKARAVASARIHPVDEALKSSAAFIRGMDEFKRRQDQGLAYDGSRLQPVRVDVLDGEFVFHCQKVSYAYTCALSQVGLERFAVEGAAPLYPIWRHPAPDMGIDTVLISAEGLMLLSKRSARVGKWPGLWSAGFGEGLEEEDLGRATFLEASLRCFHEELAMPEPPTELLAGRHRVVGIVREPASHTWNIYAMLDLRGLDVDMYGAQAVMSRASGAQDGWEASALMAIEPSKAAQCLGQAESVPGTRFLASLVVEALGEGAVAPREPSRMRQAKEEGTLASPIRRVGVLDSLTRSKRLGGAGNEDGFIATAHCFAVVDGASAKGEELFDGKSAGAFAKDVVLEALAGVEENEEPEALVRRVTHALATQILRVSGASAQGMDPIYRPSASMVAYLPGAGKLVFVGDCHALLDSKPLGFAQPFEATVAKMRSNYFHGRISAGESVGELVAHAQKEGSKVILPALHWGARIRNISKNPWSFSVFDGTWVPMDLVNVVDVPIKARHIVLGSDGYVSLMGSLALTEDALSSALKADPLCVDGLMGCKGVLDGHVSFDDRTYLSLRLEWEPT